MEFAITYATDKGIAVELIEAVSELEAWNLAQSVFGQDAIEVERIK